MEAILTNQVMLYMPRFMYVALGVKRYVEKYSLVSRKQTAKISTKLYDLIHNEKYIGHTDRCGFWTVESGQGDCQKSEPLRFIVQTYRITFTLKNNFRISMITMGNLTRIRSWLTTARQRSCGKVLFSQVSVSHSVHGGDLWFHILSRAGWVWYLWYLVPSGGKYVQECGYDLGRGAGMSRGRVPIPAGHGIQWDMVRKWAVHILRGMLSCCDEGLAHYLTDKKTFLVHSCVHESHFRPITDLFKVIMEMTAQFMNCTSHYIFQWH